jgi:formylmethanofuran dehydrogenase subunit E
MGQYAGELLGLDLPQPGKRLLTIVETDGCAADGIAIATNCWLGRRTLRVEDYGKVAATFVDTQTGTSLRIVPRPTVRSAALTYAPQARSKWEAQLVGYQLMAPEALFDFQPVELTTPFQELISRPGRKAICSQCGEEIMNEREVIREGELLCRACAGPAYYHVSADGWSPCTLPAEILADLPAVAASAEQGFRQ